MTDKDSGPTRAPDTARGNPPQPAISAASPRDGIPLRRWLWLLTLSLSIACFAVQAVFGTSEIDADGFLREPLFGLIPVSLALMLITLVLGVLDIALSRRARRSTEDSR